MHSFYLVASPNGEAQAFLWALFSVIWMSIGIFTEALYPIMARRLILTISCLLVCMTFVLGQAKTGPAAARATFQKGTELLLANKFKRAAKLFSEAVEQDSTLVAASRFLGVAEEQQRNYAAAAAAYERVIDRDPYFSRLLYHQLATVYYRMSQPAVAMEYYLLFKDLQELPIGEFGRNGEEEAAAEKKVLASLENDIRAASITQDSSQFINVTELINLGAPINTIRSDLFPFLSNDRLLMFYTREGEFGDEDLIRGKRSSRDKQFTVSRFSQLNTTVKKEGVLSFVRDGERVYFAQCDQDDVSRNHCKIYSGRLLNGVIEDVEMLPEYITEDNWVSQPAISCDGQQLFFASTPNRSEDTDIYRCIKLQDGSWSAPVRLGAGVNSPGNEQAPFLSNDGRVLYFTSNGHASLGGYDIFMSFWDETQQHFTQAINLGPPVNGPHFEIGFHLTADGRTGYVASDRPGGRGGLDIYRFELAEGLSAYPVTYVSGYVTDSLTGAPIAGQAIPVANGNTYYTNEEGRFFICAPASKTLPLSVSRPDYRNYVRDFAIPAWDNLKPYRIDLLLSKDDPPPAPEPVVVETTTEPEPEPEERPAPRYKVKKKPGLVRFDFNDASLTPYQLEILERFVASVKDKEIVRISITGFTDDVGEASYNIKLSQDRAKAVAIYLQNAGLRADEIKIIGMGELPGGSQRALNRKVEISVTYKELIPID